MVKEGKMNYSKINPKIFKKTVKYFYDENIFSNYAFTDPNIEYERLYSILSKFINSNLTKTTISKIYKL
ncbi:MAG: hypothetical protein LBV51_04615 [Acholeplasmatales bacterium]|jgi:hypothetical protein|nr:hypothetical protein [Acholeplasmatales bacterium]